MTNVLVLVGSLRAGSTSDLLTWVTTVDGLLVAALLLVSLRLVRGVSEQPRAS